LPFYFRQKYQKGWHLLKGALRKLPSQTKNKKREREKERKWEKEKKRKREKRKKKEKRKKEPREFRMKG